MEAVVGYYVEALPSGGFAIMHRDRHGVSAEVYMPYPTRGEADLAASDMNCFEARANPAANARTVAESAALYEVTP